MTFLVLFCFISAVIEARIAEPEKNPQRMGCPDDSGMHLPINRVNTTSRLQQLRVAMASAKLVRGAPLKAYIVTSDDEHQVTR